MRRKLERVRYYRGQTLRALDFRDLGHIEAERRWWHNRALHQAYGVSDGLAVSLFPATALEAVRVTPGLAYDCFGRELILEEPQSIALPASTSKATFALLLRHREPSAVARAQNFEEVCWTEQKVRGRGTAEFCWKPDGEFAPTDGVPLAKIEVAPHAALKLISFAVPTSRPMARPPVAFGTTLPGNTPWAPWLIPIPYSKGKGETIAIGVQTWVDTSVAGFTRAPLYFAWLEGPQWDAASGQFFPLHFASIADESLTGFTLRLWFPFRTPVTRRLAEARAPMSSGRLANFLRFAREQQLYVAWLGCQDVIKVPFLRLGIRYSNVLILRQLLNTIGFFGRR